MPGFDGERRYRAFVEVETETRGFRQNERAIFYVELSIDQPAKIQHLRIRKEFDEIAVRNRSDQVDVQIVKPMRAHFDAVACSGRSDTPKFGDPTADGGVGLEDCGRTLVKQT